MYPDPALTLADQILGIVGVFLKTLAPEACRLRIGLYQIAIWKRVKKFERRFLALYSMWKAGTLPKARVRPISPPPLEGGGRGEGCSGTISATAHPSPVPPPSRGGGVFDPMARGGSSFDLAKFRPASVLPRSFAWLHRMLPNSASTLASYLGSVVRHHPEIQAFVADCPQAGRLLRPICKMAGVKPPDYLALPKRVRKPGLRRRPAAPPRLRQPRRRDYASAKEEALAWMRWSAATHKPVNPRKMSAEAFGYVLHWPRDGNCPPPEIGYGGRWPPLPKDYKRPDWG